MPEDKLSVFYDSLVANPNIKGLPSDCETFRRTLRDPYKSQVFYNSLKANPHITGIPDTYEKFTGGLSLGSKILEGPDAQFEQEWSDKNFLEKTGAGIKRGWKNLQSGIMNFAAEAVPILSAGSIPKPAMEMALTPLKYKAEEKYKEAESIQGKGLAFEVGQFMPQMAGTFAALAAAPFTGGTSAGAIPGIIGMANIGAITTSVVGNTLLEVEDYSQENSIPISEAKKWSVALLAGAAEFAAEKLRLDRFLPKGLTSKMVAAVAKQSPEVAESMMKQWAKASPKMYQKFLQFVKTTAQNGFEEGAEEFFTQIAQDYANYLYQDKKDRLGFNEIMSNAIQAGKGGALMGGFIGPASFASSEITTKLRRERNGGMTLVQTNDGKVSELIGQDDKGKMIVQNSLGKMAEIDESEIQDRISLTNDEMNQYLDAYHNGQEMLPQIEQQIKHRNTEDQIHQIGMKLKFGDAPLMNDPNPVISFADTKIGQKVILKKQSNFNDDNLFIAYDANELKESMYDFGKTKPIFLKASDIQNRLDIPYKEWVAGEIAEYNNTIQAGQDMAAAIDSPYEAGQEIDYQGKKWRIAEVNSNGIVADEITEDGMPGQSVEIPNDQFNMIAGNEAQAQQVVQTQPAGAPVQQAPQPKARKISDGKNDLIITPQEDGSFIVNQVFNTQKTAETTANKLNELYPKVDFQVQVKDSGDPFTSDDYTIVATVKAAKQQAAPQAERVTEQKPAIEPWQMSQQEYVNSQMPKNLRPEFVDQYKNRFISDHKLSVADAVRNGKDVPGEVLAAYPDLQSEKQTKIKEEPTDDQKNQQRVSGQERERQEPEQAQPDQKAGGQETEAGRVLQTQGEEQVEKEPWQMTREEFWNQSDAQRIYGRMPEKNKGPYLSLHKAAVEKALEEGKPVQQEVIDEYPDLLNKVEKANTDLTRANAEVDTNPTEAQKKISDSAKRKGSIKPRTRTSTVIAGHSPRNFTEAVLDFFVSGGRVSYEDFIRHTGYKHADAMPFIGLLKSKDKGGVSLDVFHEHVDNSFDMESQAMDMENAIIDVMLTYPSKAKMLTELERRYEIGEGEEPTDEDMAKDYTQEAPVDKTGPASVDNFVARIMASEELISIFTDIEFLDDGKILWDKLRDKIANNPGYFTWFPFGLNEEELNNLKILANDSDRQRILEAQLARSDRTQSQSEKHLTNKGTEGVGEGAGRKRSQEGPTERPKKPTVAPELQVKQGPKKPEFTGELFESSKNKKGNKPAKAEGQPATKQDAKERTTKNVQNPNITNKSLNDLENDISSLHEQAQEYITKNEVYTQAAPIQNWPEGVSYVSERASGRSDNSGQLDLWGQSDYTATPESGDISYSERLISENKTITFIGEPLTGSHKINGSDDVAFLFKNLENAATENVFAVFIDENNDYKVLYVSSGSTIGSVIDTKLVAAAAKDFNAKSVYFVHNHPSGNLNTSAADIAIYGKLKGSLDVLGIELKPGIIIDLDSGKYTAFTDVFQEQLSLDKEEYQRNVDAILQAVHQFDRKVLYVPSDEITKVSGSQDVAMYLSKMKRGATPKLHVLILDRQNKITKYFLLDETISDKDLTTRLIYEVGKHGENVILSSNRGIEINTLRELQNSLSAIDAKLLDAIIVKSNDEITNNYESYADQGLINEPEKQYSTLVNEPETPLQSAGPPINILQKKGQKRVELWQNRMLSLREWQNKIRGRGGKITDISNPYRQENLSHGMVKQAIMAFDEQYLDPLEKVASEIMEKANMTYDELNEYMQAKHAPERNKEIALQKMSRQMKVPYEELRQMYENDEMEDIMREAVDNSINAGMSNSQARKIIEKYEAKMDKKKISDFWKAVNDATRFTVKRWLSDGFISMETSFKILNQYNYYVPLRNWKKTDADMLYEYQIEDIGKSVNPLKKARGRKSLADDPMQYIVNMAHSAVVMGEKNRIKQHAARLIRDNKDMKDMHKFKKVYAVWDGTEDEEGNRNYVEVLEKPDQELWDKGYVKTRYDMSHVKRRSKAQAEQHEVDVFIGGEKYTMILPVDVSGALNKTPSKWDNVAFILREWKIGQFTRWLSTNFTSKNPAFILTNQLRDLQYATLAHFIKGDTKEALDFIKVLPRARKAIIQHIKGKGDAKDPAYKMYRDFLVNGGETGYVHMKDVDQLQREIKRDLARLTGTNSTFDKTIHSKILRNAGLWMEHMAVRSENLSRFATYIVAKNQGKSDREAAFAAKEITVNFNRKGGISALLGSLYAFFNASLQGGENIIRMSKEHTAKFFAIGAAGMAMGFLTALLNSLWGGDDEDDINKYDSINDYIKYNNFVFMIPGTKKYLSVPLPHGFRWFNSLGVLAYQSLFKNQKDAYTTLKDGISNAFAAISPVNPVEFLSDEGEFTIRPAVPTFAMPFYDIAVNQTFTGAQVHKTPFTQALNGRIADSALGMDYVNTVVKDFTDFLFKLGGGDPETGSKYYMNDKGEIVPVKSIFDQNPSDIEHVIEYYLGGRGTFWNNIMKTTQNIVESAHQLTKEGTSFSTTIEAINMNEVPVARSIIRQPWKTSVYSRYYDIVDNIENYKSMVNMNNKAIDPTIEAPKSYSPQYQYKIDLLSDLKRDLKSLDEDIEHITDTEQIREIKDVQERLIRNFIDEVSKYNEQ